MFNFLLKGFKRIMSNIEKMIGEISDMTVSEAFPLVKALKDKFGATWPPTLITSVKRTADGEVKLDEETQSYTVGGSSVTLTIEPTASPNTYSSVKLVQTAPGGIENEVPVDMETLKATVAVDALENGIYSLNAFTVDEFGKTQTKASPEIKVHIKNENPDVLAIIIDEPEKRNHDSGAPQGNLTVNAYTPQRAVPAITDIRFEVKRNQETEWQSVGEVDKDSSVLDTEQERLKWTVTFDTNNLDDTITKDSDAARDVLLDKSPYMLRAVAIKANGGEIVSLNEVIQEFSVDNIDDVAPLGPTEIIEVVIPENMIPVDEFISYTTHRAEPQSTTAIFVTQPKAAENTYSSVKLMRTNPDETQDECSGLNVKFGIRGETIDSSYTVKFDVSSLENGVYAFHALAIDEAGNIQTDESPRIKFLVRKPSLPPQLIEDDDERLNPVKNPERRTKQLQQQLLDAPKKGYESRNRSVRTTRGTIDPRTQLRAQYTKPSGEMECQLCDRTMPFKDREGKPYFEAVEVLTNNHFTREHEAQFLALCPECAARYNEFVKRVPKVMEDLKNELKDTDGFEVPLQLGDLSTNLRFSERHLHDIQTILRFYEQVSNMDTTQ